MNLPATNVSLAFGLPAAWYHDPQIYERERQAVFRREWIWLGRAGPTQQPRRLHRQRVRRLAAVRDPRPRGCVARLPQRLPPSRRTHPEGRPRPLRTCCAAVITAGPTTRPAACAPPPHFGNAVDFDKKDFGLHPIRVATWRGFRLRQSRRGSRAARRGPRRPRAGSRTLYPLEDLPLRRRGKRSRWTATGRSIPTTTSAGVYHIPRHPSGLQRRHRFREVRYRGPQPHGHHAGAGRRMAPSTAAPGCGAIRT
jgi:hypothetical protein